MTGYMKEMKRDFDLETESGRLDLCINIIPNPKAEYIGAYFAKDWARTREIEQETHGLKKRLLEYATKRKVEWEELLLKDYENQLPGFLERPKILKRARL